MNLRRDIYWRRVSLRTTIPILLTLLILGFPTDGFAQPSPSPSAPHVSFSGYVQPQYELRDSDGEMRDRTFFRRLVLTLDATGPGNWNGEFQADAGPLASGGSRLVVKNAYVQYTGWRARGIVLTIGNQKMPFSQSLYQSSARRGLIERPFTGDRSFGGPGRGLGIKADGWHRHKTVYWSGAVASLRQSPDPDEIRIDGATETDGGWSEGPMAAARIEWHPLGEVARDHGDFARGPGRFTIGGATYRWWNDNDVARHGAGTVDARHVTAVELSGGFKGYGATVEAELERIDAEALDSSITLGLYAGGTAVLHKSSVETGYMLGGTRLEALASVDSLTTEAFDVPWRRLAAGLNFYVHGHQLKFSLMHRESFDDRGVDGARSRATYLQTQFGF